MPELSTRQAAFVAALLSCQTRALASKKAGVSEITGNRWYKLPEVQAALREAKQDVIERALDQLSNGTPEAVQTLRDVLRDAEAPASARIRAAQIILETVLELRKYSEIEERLEELEQRLALYQH